MSKNFLKEIRKKNNNISLAELSRRTEISSQSLHNFENGKSNLGTDKINKLLQVLNIKYEELFGIEQQEYPKISVTSSTNKDLLGKAIKIAQKNSYNITEEESIELSTILYSILVDFESIQHEDNKIEFIEKIKSKILEGLGAQIFLESELEIETNKIINIPNSFHYDNHSIIPKNTNNG